MEEGARVFGWNEKWKGWLQPSAVTCAKRRGVGVGVHGNSDVGESVSEAYVRLDPNGTASIYSAVSEHGTGQRSSLCKMVAEVLQLPLDRIFLSPSDSAITPYEFGPVGAPLHVRYGQRLHRRSGRGAQKLFQFAAPLLDADPEDMETVDGLIFSRRKPDKKIPWKAALALIAPAWGKGGSSLISRSSIS